MAEESRAGWGGQGAYNHQAPMSAEQSMLEDRARRIAYQRLIAADPSKATFQDSALARKLNAAYLATGKLPGD